MDPDAPPLSALSDVLPFALNLGFEPTIVVVELVIFVLLLLTSALFSGAEVALFSLGPKDQEKLEQAQDRRSKRVLALLAYPRKVLITILLLNNFVNVSAAILAALITVQIASAFSLSPTLIFVIEVVVLTFVLLVVSEITPKLIATRRPVAFARRISGVLMLLHRILSPFSSILSRGMQFVQNRFKPSEAPRISQEDLKAMAEIGEAHGTLQEDERDLITSIVEFGDTAVRAIMISRVDMIALPVTKTLPEALDIIRKNGHSRLPLFVDHLDNILGIVYAKDLLPYLKNGQTPERVDWTRLMRPPMFVPDSRKLDDLLQDFQRKRTHLAIVVDEYGGTAGLVTLEDVLEEIVGDIRDEHDDPEERLYERLDDLTVRADARIDLDDLNDLLDLDLDTESFDFETLGGLIFHLTGDIPNEGDEVLYGRLRMQVETVFNNRIGQVHLQVTPPTDEEHIAENGVPENV